MTPVCPAKFSSPADTVEPLAGNGENSPRSDKCASLVLCGLRRISSRRASSAVGVHRHWDGVMQKETHVRQM